MTKLMDAIYITYRYEEQIEKKTILNKHENNYTSKVEKRLIVNDFLSRFSLTQRNVNVTEKMTFLICLCV